MKAQKVTSWILLLSLVAPYVSAANISQKSAGDCSQNVVAKGQVTINCGLSKEEVEKIVAVYAEKHHLTDEQVAALSVAITALGAGAGYLGSKIEINEAIAALKQGSIEKSQNLFLRKLDKEEIRFGKLHKNSSISNKQAAEIYRNLGVLSSLNLNSEFSEKLNERMTLYFYFNAVRFDPDNIDDWNRLLYTISQPNVNDGSYIAFLHILDAYTELKKLEKTHPHETKISNILGEFSHLLVRYEIYYPEYWIELHSQSPDMRGNSELLKIYNGAAEAAREAVKRAQFEASWKYFKSLRWLKNLF